MLGNMMTLPLMFLSSAMVPKSFMPEWIRVITKINPIDYAVEATRAFYSGGTSLHTTLVGFLFLSLFAVAAISWATELFMNQSE